MTSQIDITKPVFGTPTTQSVRDNFTTAANEISVLQQQTSGSPFLSLQGGRMAGPMYLYNDPTDAMMPATKGYVDAGGGGGGGGIPEAPAIAGQVFGRSEGAWVNVVALVGGTLTGPLIAAADPTAALGMATKQYVDALKPTILPDAPNDAFFYGRHANAWAQVLALTGGVLSGSLGVGITPPSDVSTTVRPVMAGHVTVSGSGGFGLNTYLDTTGAWRYLATGAAAIVNVTSTGVMALIGAASGTADTAINWAGPVRIDPKGDLMLSSGPTIPTDVNTPTMSAAYYAAPTGGSYSWNMYTATGGTAKYLNAGYANSLWLDGSGRLNISLAPNGPAGGNITSNAAFTFDQAGALSVPGTLFTGGQVSVSSTAQNAIVANGGATFGLNIGTQVINQNGQFVSRVNGPGAAFCVHDTSQNVAAGLYEHSSGGTPQIYFAQMNGLGAPTTNWMYMQPNALLPFADNYCYCGIGGNAWTQCASYSFANASDERLKHHVADAPAGALAAVNAIAVKNFHWEQDADDAPLHIGWLAGDVQAALPELATVIVNEDEQKTLALNVLEMTAILWKAVQELSAQVEGKRT